MKTHRKHSGVTLGTGRELVLAGRFSSVSKKKMSLR